MKVVLNEETNILNIQQETTYFNKSNNTLKKLFFHNWMNSFKNNKTPLGKRFLDDYSKDFYFSKEHQRGYSKINSLTINNKHVSFSEIKNQPDILKIILNNPLLTNDSVKINTSYIVKIPDAKFTKYGKNKTGFNLRFWYLTPVIYQKKWQVMSNLNMDDLYEDVSNFSINIDIPKSYTIESNLNQSQITKNSYQLTGKHKDITLQIIKENNFISFETKNIEVKTDIFKKETAHSKAQKIVEREINFIERNLGIYPHKKILIDANTASKNSIQEIYQLPSWLKPYPENFNLEIRFLKALITKYIDDVLLLNKRKDYWLSNGIKIFLMIKYLKEYYPKITLLGKFSKIWGVRNYNIAKLKQYEKFSHLYQFSIRQFYDQPLTMSADSLSNFNRKVISQYKAGLGLKYLQDFIGDSILNKSIKEFYHKNKLKIINSKSFEKNLKENTNKDINWFFNDFIKTSKKIDYTINKVVETNDSINITIKNKRDFTAPISLYGIKNKEIIFKHWFNHIDSTKTITIPKGNFDKLALNYQKEYPEYNYLNNYRNINNTLLHKPIQFRLFKDIEEPYYNQIYFEPTLKYNYYDGAILGLRLNNNSIIPHNLKMVVSPAYGIKSSSITGSFNFLYNDYAKPKSSIYKTTYGFSGSYQHYKENLTYKAFSSYAQIAFKRNSLRDVGGNFLGFTLRSIDKSIPENQEKLDEDNYVIFGAKYFNSKPNIIEGKRYAIGTEVTSKFSKITAQFRYRKLTGLDRRMEFRIFAGVFLHNNTNGDYFSFGLDRANDYLFQLNYFGRSEESGIFSQQFILAEGGFKSRLKTRSANQFLTSFNSNIGVWRWAEIYNDLAFVKNKGNTIYTAYEGGVRLNFVPGIFELYFPVYSNNGWEVTQKEYPTKIRFVLTANINAIYNFIRRGIL